MCPAPRSPSQPVLGAVQCSSSMATVTNPATATMPPARPNAVPSARCQLRMASAVIARPTRANAVVRAAAMSQIRSQGFSRMPSHVLHSYAIHISGVWFRSGTFERIAGVLGRDEDRADFIREAGAGVAATPVARP